MSRPDPQKLTSFAVRLMVSLRTWSGQWLLLCQIMIATVPSPIQTKGLIHRLPALPGNAPSTSKLRGTGATFRNGTAADWSVSCVKRPSWPAWKAEAAGNSLADSALFSDAAQATLSKEWWTSQLLSWLVRSLKPCAMTRHWCCSSTTPRFHRTMRPGSIRTRSAAPLTHNGMWWNSKCRCCCNGHCRLSSEWVPCTPSQGGPSLLRVAACTGTSCYCCGLCSLTNTDWLSNNGSMDGPTEFRSWSLLPMSRNQRAAHETDETRGLPLQQAGRPGPNAGGSMLFAAHTWHHNTSQHATDTRVGGSQGRSPPEAPSTCLSECTAQAKLFDPNIPDASLNRLGALGPALVNVLSFACLFYWFHCSLGRQPLPLLRLWLVLIASMLQCTEQLPETSFAQTLTCLALGFLGQLGVWIQHKTQHPIISFFPTRMFPGCIRRRPGALRMPLLRAGSAASQQADHQDQSAFRLQGRSQHQPQRPPKPPYSLWLYLLLQCLVIGTKASPSTCAHSLDAITLGQTSPPRSVLRAHGAFAQQLSMSRKRSFKRAQTRALRDGVTTYKGRQHTPGSLSLKYVGLAPPRHLKPPMPNPECLRFLTWNAGGLHAARYAETLAWLECEREAGRPAQILCIQESKWPRDCEYSTGRWHVVHSGSGSALGGVVFFICRTLVAAQQLKHAALVPGRALHLRVATQPALDLLGVYQHAWSNARQPAGHTENSSAGLQKLLQSRSRVWTMLESWTRAVPQRHRLLILGDLNCTLHPQEPHVGQGVAHHKHTVHQDQHTLQTIVETRGLIALNTWGRRGRPAGTYLHLQQSTVQIDFLITRLPCQPVSRCARALPAAPIVHPTGFRHVPVEGYLPSQPQLPTTPEQNPDHFNARTIQARLSADPTAAQTFQQHLGKTLQTEPSLEASLRVAWQRSCTESSFAKHSPMTLHTSGTTPVPTTTLKTYWCAKRNLSQTQAQLAKYHAPLVWHMADAAASTVIRHFPRSGRALKLLFHHWRVSLSFRQQDRALRRRVRQNKVQRVDQLIQQAQTAHSSSLQGLYQLSKQLRPKTPKRSIHFRDATGMLLGSAEELRILQNYFEELYQSSAASQSEWRLTVPFQVTTEEAAEALHHTSGRKALPQGQVPAVLWKTAEPLLAEAISRDLNAALQPGPIRLPDDWNCAYMALLPKPNKPPCQPANLRPISILPMLPKLLARIAASRLKPYLLAALQEVPQFAYMMGRQVNDALDRVISHCYSVRELLKGGSRSVVRLQEGRRDPLLRGGMQLSLDLSKAYDKLPRCFLLQTLERVGAPAELSSLIMYIHDSAIIVITKSAESAHIRMGRGIRQGCGLSPMLWIGFTLLLFDKLHAVLPDNTLTGYADDFHALWQFEHPRDFRNAIGQIPRIMEVLRFYGMDIALDKTAILLAIQGRAAPHLLRDFAATVRGHRCLVIRHPSGNLSIPIKTSHPYLGVLIGYHSFEQATVKHRLAQSWVAFHRLHVFLKHNQIPQKKRMQLWIACVWSIIQHGLTSTGLDSVSTSLLIAQTSKQLRMVARSPAHVHHVTNTALYDRLCWDGPLPQLLRAATRRVTSCRSSVGHLQPARVHQWWELILRSFQPTPLPDSPARLTEVTNVLQLRSMCPICGIGFPSHHAVSVRQTT